jgi:hypothetical protein
VILLRAESARLDALRAQVVADLERLGQRADAHLLAELGGFGITGVRRRWGPRGRRGSPLARSSSLAWSPALTPVVSAASNWTRESANLAPASTTETGHGHAGVPLRPKIPRATIHTHTRQSNHKPGDQGCLVYPIGTIATFYCAVCALLRGMGP